MSILEKLKPIKRNKIIDLVAEAGLDVSDWANYSGHPASNPKYCYEWAYVDERVGIVLNLWHEECSIENNQILQKLNFSERLADLTNIGNSVGVGRARRMQSAIHSAISKNLPIRVILLDGTRRKVFSQDRTSSRVEKRLLDPEPWSVQKYHEATGEVILVRGEVSEKYCDQFMLQESNEIFLQRKEVTSAVFVRDPNVRKQALLRAEGHCEYCGIEGFMMSNGSVYLETHHIISLAENGPDTILNVIALCPNHHRQAHYGDVRAQLKNSFLKIVTGRA